MPDQATVFIPPRALDARQRAGLSRQKRRLSKRRRLARILAGFVVGICGLGLLGAIAIFIVYQNFRSDIPDAATLAAMEPPLDSHVYARDGTLIAILHDPNFRHEHVALKDISPLVRMATIDVEDKHFYTNSSWDLPRIAKAAYDDFRHRPTQGASTITQQLAKVSFLCSTSCTRSISYKIKQVILGSEIESNFSKDQILEMYLNRISYGNHAIGIQSAAHAYFHKDASQLDLAEASMLSGLPNSPTAYDPLNHDPSVSINPLSVQRQRVVLDAMVSNHDITSAQADAAAAEKLTFHPYYDSEPTVAPHFLDYLRSYLNQKFGDAYIKPGGWDITTTLDLGKQALAESSLHDGVQSIYKDFNAHDGALVNMDPNTGEVLAMIGAWDPNNSQVGDLNMADRQVRPGSTIKLFTYTTAIASHKYTMTTPIVDAPVTLNDGSSSGYSPHNYDRRYHGTCTVATCLGDSLNIPAVKVEYDMGVPYITNFEIAAGIQSLADPSNRPGPHDYAATLGGLSYGTSPLELATGVSTIADLGVEHDPTPVLKIVDSFQNKPIYTHNATLEGRRVLPADVAFIMSEITSNDNNRRAEFGAHSALTLADRRVSAKTGTTEFFEDNWTVGWTPQLVTVVWVGNPSPSCLRSEDRGTLQNALNRGDYLYPQQTIDDPYSPGDLAHYELQPVNDHCGHLEGSTGVTGAAPIWNNFMKQALANTPKTWYTKPADVIANGSGDDANFYLPGTASAESQFGQGCYYYGQLQPGNQCRYLGPTAPQSSPTPATQAGNSIPFPNITFDWARLESNTGERLLRY